MPELPDITIYVEALERCVLGEPVVDIRIRSPFLLRTFDPPLKSVNGKAVRKVRRLGKRIALGFDDELWLVLHLMIAGRLHWKPAGVKLLGKSSLASFDLLRGAYSSPRRVQNIVRRSTWFAVKMPCESTTREVSSRSRQRSINFKLSSAGRTTRSREPSPIRAYSAVSATRIPTRSSTVLVFRHLP